MIAVVTGASSGIGEATARLLAREHGAHVVLVARREDRLRKLADELGGGTVVACDITGADAPARIREAIEAEHGRLDLLVNNAGSAWRGTLLDLGPEGMERHMRLNFDAQARVTNELVPLLRRSAPASIVNVASVAGRISRARSVPYSASKFALIGWSDGLYAEERPHGVHVGLVLPGFVVTEGFPQRELTERWLTKKMVSTPEKVARAIVQAGPGGKAECYVPRPWRAIAALRTLAPGLMRRAGGHAPAPETTSS